MFVFVVFLLGLRSAGIFKFQIEVLFSIIDIDMVNLTNFFPPLEKQIITSYTTFMQ